MPTWKGMFNARRVPVTLCVTIALICAPSVAAAVTPTSNGGSTAPDGSGAPGTTTPSTLVPGPGNTPAPPAFSLPTDFGLQLINEQNAAKDAIAGAQKALPDARKSLAAAQHEDSLAQKRLKSLSSTARATEAKLAATRSHLRAAAAQAYIHADSGDLAAAISSFTNASSAMEAGSQLHLISSYGNNEEEALQQYLSLKARVDSQVSAISDLRDRTSRALSTAKKNLNALQSTIASSKKQLAAALAGIKEFEAAATSASSPILGPSQLSANQMADYVMANGGHPNITVPLVNLAQMYLIEGEKTGVRGDVAFAQSILETGSFAFPGSAATDNNFAGIGWCDSCAHGFNFPDAETGVRAQLQDLRIYVDPKFPDASYTDPILMPGQLKLGFRGKVQTWWDLWGTWATGALYGQRVYDIYLKMVAFAATDPPQPAPVITPPADLAPPPPGATTSTVSPITWPPGSGPGTKK
jgi:Mannosyl-glycoprotein endo-beta-N-acetylglucosaminidase